MEDPLQEVVVPGSFLDVEDDQGGEGVNGLVDIAEGPLVGGQLAVGVHVPLAAREERLLFGEPGVDVDQGDGVEGEIPGCEPGASPLSPSAP